jgi:hypothetical protein
MPAVLVRLRAVMVGMHAVTARPHTVMVGMHAVTARLHTVMIGLHAIMVCLHAVTVRPHAVTVCLHAVLVRRRAVTDCLHAVRVGRLGVHAGLPRRERSDIPDSPVPGAESTRHLHVSIGHQAVARLTIELPLAALVHSTLRESMGGARPFVYLR